MQTRIPVINSKIRLKKNREECLMRHEDQMKWIEKNLELMQEKIKKDPNEEIKADYRALLSIKYDYKHLLSQRHKL